MNFHLRKTQIPKTRWEMYV